jgi:multiple sugar transport system substrate-binding protein
MAKDLTTTQSGKLSRRRLLQTSAVAGAAMTVGAKVAPAAAAPSVRDRFGAHFQGGATIKFGLTTPDQQKVQPLLDEYASANNVTIQTDTAAYDPYYAKLNVNLSTQTDAYDVVSLDDPWMPQFAGGEFLMNLDELLDKKGQKVDPDFIGALIALGDFPTGSGHRGIPWVGNVQVFCYRTDILDELGLKVPATWDDVLANAQAISDAKKDAGLYGYGCRGLTGNSANTSFLPVLRGYGGDVFKTVDFSDNDYTPQLTTDAAKAAITTHLALAKLTPPGVENTDHATNGRNMYSGLTAASGDIWPDQLLEIFDPSISKVADKVAIGAEPAQSGVPNKDMTGNWLLGIPNGSKNADAALDFILWFTAPEQQKKLLLEHQIPATRTSVMQDEEAVAKFSFLPGLLAAGQNAVPRPRTDLYPQIDESILGVYIAQAIAGQISGEDALKKANDDITALMKREGKL